MKSNEILEGEKLHQTITEEEVKSWCAMTLTDCTLSRLTDILTGVYRLDDARDDVLSFRPSSN